jgi:Proton-conducting membrane transporter/LAGLIDADG endonuclease
LPTPVSALIHAATMVTAGVYLLMRCSPLLEQSPLGLLIVTITGAVTSFFAASVGIFQNDIKKIIAYSTMSQLAQEYYLKLIIFRHQTICVELILNNICNSQITKTHIYNKYISNNFFNSFFALRQYLIKYIYVIMSVKWEIIIISRLVGISEAIRLVLITYQWKYNIFFHDIYIFILKIKWKYIKIINRYKFLYLFIIKKFSIDILKYNKDNINLLRLESNNLSYDLKSIAIDFKSYNQDKYFFESKHGTARIQITMDVRDIKVLNEIKQKLGGTIRSIANTKAVKYQLSHKKGLIYLLNNINGLIRNPIRLLQMNKLCIKYGINILYPKPLIYNNGWLSGIIDSDGSIYLNENSGQIFISITQKNKYLLEPLILLYGGRVDILSPKIEAFKYIIYRKKELFDLIDNYFSKYPLKTKKNNRLHKIKEFYNVRITNKNKDIYKLKEWVIFKDQWEKYSD